MSENTNFDDRRFNLMKPFSAIIVIASLLVGLTITLPLLAMYFEWLGNTFSEGTLLIVFIMGFTFLLGIICYACYLYSEIAKKYA